MGNQYGTQEGYSKEGSRQEGPCQEDHREEGPCQEEDGRQEAGQEDYCQEGPRQEEDHQEVNERSAKHHHVAAPMAHPSASLQRYNAAHNVGTATSCADCA